MINPFTALQTLGVATLAVAGAFVAGELHGHSRGMDAKQAEWNAALLARAADVEKANMWAQSVALAYETRKAAQAPRIQQANAEVTHAVENAPEWGSLSLPSSVRDAIAARLAISDSSGPDGAVPAGPQISDDERGIGEGIHPSARWLERLPGSASSPR